MPDSEGILIGLIIGIPVGLTIGFFLAQYIKIGPLPPLSEPSFAVERGPNGEITRISVVSSAGK